LRLPRTAATQRALTVGAFHFASPIVHPVDALPLVGYSFDPARKYGAGMVR
jgi:hypothetical protein